MGGRLDDFQFIMNKTSKSSLIMLLGDPSCDPRPSRMIDTLSQQGFIVDVLSYEANCNVNARQQWKIKKNFSSKLLRKAIQLTRYAISVIPKSTIVKNLINNLAFRLTGLNSLFVNHDYTNIIVEDLFMLPLAFDIKKNAKVIFDAREYYPRQNEERFFWRIFEKPERVRLCAQYLDLCDYILTVSPGLQREYKKNFGVDAILYRSVPRYSTRTPRSTDSNHIKIVHHGIANPNRKLDKMIEVVIKLDSRFYFDMYLTGSQAEITSLRAQAADCKRVRILNPVPYQQINETLSSYDIGLFYNEPSTFNLLHCLPNKIFEFIQARLAIAVGPSPDMAMLVRQYNLGLVASEFTVESMADSINKLSLDEINLYKTNAHKAAELLCHENETKKILAIFG